MTAFEMSSNYLMLLIVSMGLAICSTERNSADVCMSIYIYNKSYVYLYFRIRESCLIHVVIIDISLFCLFHVQSTQALPTQSSLACLLANAMASRHKSSTTTTPRKPGRKAKISFHKNIPFWQTNMASRKIHE